MDTVVIGGGVAGLLTALRLARGGQEVLLLEADQLGSGATGANQGIVHSGALYVLRHEHIVGPCQEARAAFSMLLGDEDPGGTAAVYVVPDAEIPSFRAGLTTYGIPHQRLHPEEVPELQHPADHGEGLFAIHERVISSRRLLEVLIGQCLAAGVAIRPGTAVRRVTHDGHQVTGILAGVDEEIRVERVVAAAGLGTADLLAATGGRYQPRLRSRLDVMIHLPHARLDRGLILARRGDPVLIPAPTGGVLASFYGGVQPQVTGRRPYSVDISRVQLLLEQIRARVTAGAVDFHGGVAYAATKTDYVETTRAEGGRINPGFQVLDHGERGGIRGLYTVIAGKMTLAFHASQAVAEQMLGTRVALALAPTSHRPIPSGMLAVEPWSELTAR